MAATTVPSISGGLPILGHAADFFRSPVDLLRRGYRENGHIYGFRILNRRFVVVIGSELQKHFFRETDKTLDLRRAMPFFHTMFSKQFYSFAPWDDYMRQRGIIMPRFKGEQLRGYVPIIAEETQKLMERLGPAGEFDLVPTLGKLVMDIAAHAFLGRDFVGRLGTRDRGSGCGRAKALRVHAALRQRNLRIELRERRFRPHQCVLIGTRIDLKQELVLPDIGVVFDRQLHQTPIDLGDDADQVGADAGIVSARVEVGSPEGEKQAHHCTGTNSYAYRTAQPLSHENLVLLNIRTHAMLLAKEDQPQQAG